tara:strand:- start:126 stop:647 length:522 start_codon:yes stop_codon:yes gene_type:complete
MKNLKILIITSVFFFLTNFAYSQDIVFVNLQKILNESKAGKQAQEFLKKQIVSENKKLEKEAQQLKKEEKDLINKKKNISPEEYKKSLDNLRVKNINYQKRKRETNTKILKKKNQARTQLMQALNPILSTYMSENNIQIILEKKYVIMANTKVDLTNEILKILDNKVKSINLK